MHLRLIYIILIIILLGYYPFAPDYMDKDIITMLIVIVLICVILFFNKKEKIVELKGNYLKHSNLILISICIVQFQYFIDYLIGNIDENSTYIWVKNSIVIKSLILSIIGVLSFMIGYLQFNFTFNKKSKISESRTVNILFLEIITALFTILYFYFINPLYLLGNYGIIDIGNEAAYIAVLLEVGLMAIIIQKSRNINVESNINITLFSFLSYFRWPTLTMLSVYLISVIVSGDRGPLIFFSIAIIGSYTFVTRNKLNLIKIIVILFIGSSLITLLGQIRAIRTSQSFTEKITEIFKDDGTESRFENISFLPASQELASSVRCLHHSVSYVPSVSNFFYGRLQFQQITSIIPFFSNINNLIFLDNNSKNFSSADYITWINQGDFPTSGDGTTLISDFYLDFGMYGVLICMFIVGLIMRYSELLMYKAGYPSVFSHIFFITYLATSIYIGRSTFLIVMKMVCWTYFFLLINNYFFNYKK